MLFVPGITAPLGIGLFSWNRLIAGTLAVLWDGFWVYFGLASGISEELDPVGIIIHTAIPGLVFLVSALVSFRFGRIGGIILILEGLVVAVGYPVIMGPRFPLSTVLLVLATMALPPLIPGLLFFIDSRLDRNQTPKPHSCTWKCFLPCGLQPGFNNKPFFMWHLVKIFTKCRHFHSDFMKASIKKATTLIFISQALGLESVTHFAPSSFDDG